MLFLRSGDCLPCPVTGSAGSAESVRFGDACGSPYAWSRASVKATSASARPANARARSLHAGCSTVHAVAGLVVARRCRSASPAGGQPPDPGVGAEERRLDLVGRWRPSPQAGGTERRRPHPGQRAVEQLGDDGGQRLGVLEHPRVGAALHRDERARRPPGRVDRGPVRHRQVAVAVDDHDRHAGLGQRVQQLAGCGATASSRWPGRASATVGRAWPSRVGPSSRPSLAACARVAQHRQRRQRVGHQQRPPRPAAPAGRSGRRG